MGHGRHRPRRSPVKILAVGVLVAVVVGAVSYSGYRWVLPAVQASGCGNALTLKVAASPDIAPAVTQAATQWNATDPTSGGRCVRAEVTSVASNRVAAALTSQYAPTSGQSGSPSGAPVETPGLWIPDSTSWLDQVRAINTNAFAEVGASIASTPLVIAAPEAQAKSLGLGAASITPPTLISLLHGMRNGDLTGTPTKFQLGLSNPGSDTAAFAAAQLLGSLDKAAQDGLPQGAAVIADYRVMGPVGQDSADSAALMNVFENKVAGTLPMTAAIVSEQAVVAQNATNSASPYKATALAGYNASLDYPAAAVGGTPANVSQAATNFAAALASSAYRGIFALHGFRAPTGVASPEFQAGHGAGEATVKPTPVRYDKNTAAVVALWAAANEQAQVLTLVDVASSMGTPSPQAGLSRLQLTSAAAQAGLKLFTPHSSVGLWGFGPGISKTDYLELAPLGPLTENLNKVQAAFKTAQPTPATGCGLYPTLADAYKKMREGYVSGEINTIVVFTSCADAPPDNRMTQSALLNTLENMADPASPIRVVLINVGPASNSKNLSAIASTVGGNTVTLLAPGQIESIFMGALVALS